MAADAAAVAEKAAADKAAADKALADKAALEGKSALAVGQEKPEQWIPEKYHVRKDGAKDGPIDVEASMRALAKANAELTKRMVDVGLPPEDADKYDITELPKDFDVAEFRKDPATADFLKGAHSLGMTNKQVNYVINKYLAIAPELAGAAQDLTAQETIAQLKLTWKSEAELAGNLKASYNATTKLAETIDMTYDDVDAVLGNNPIFIRLMAGLAKQMGEDVPPHDQTIGDGADADFDAQAKKLRLELDAIPERNRKERAAVQAKLDALYARRYGTAVRAPLLTIRAPAPAKSDGKAA